MPGWRLKEQLVIIGMRNAIAVDGLNNSRDMSMHPAKPRDFEGFFDTIAYEKGYQNLLIAKIVTQHCYLFIFSGVSVHATN